MWLERQNQPAIGKCAACSRNGGRHFYRVMAVIVNQRKASLFSIFITDQFDFSVALKTTVHTSETRQCPGYSGVCHTYFVAYRNCRERILHIVQSWQIKHDFELASLAIDSYQGGKMHLPFTMANIGSADLGSIR